MAWETLLGVFEGFRGHEGDFLVHDDGLRVRRFSYGQVATAAERFAERLSGEGLTKGDKVLIWSENRPEWIAALWGCLLAGVVVVPVDYRASFDLLLTIQRIAQAKLLLTGEEVRAEAGLEILAWPLASLEWIAPARAFAPPLISRDDLAEVLFTSGATAEPKGVLIQHKNVLANIVPVEHEVRKYLRYVRWFHPIRFLNLLPLSHMFGQAMATFIPPMIGGEVLFMSGYSPGELARQVKTRRISVVVCVPKMLELLREHILATIPIASKLPPTGVHWTKRYWFYRDVHKVFGFKFWAFIVGAAPLDPELEEFWMRMGFVVVQGYGLTETAPIVTLNHPFRTRKGTVGTPIGGVQIKIAEDGEILVRGDNVTSGYLNADAESSKAFEDGWFHTGDIGALDEAGRLAVRGRKKEMIVTPEGLNVFPEDIERTLNAIPGVRESAVIGAVEGGRERIHAVLVLERGGDPAQVVREGNGKLEDFQRIRGFTVWESGELPRTEGTRKLKRRELQQFVASGAVGKPTAASKDRVFEIVGSYAPHRALEEATTIEELGLTSLDRLEMLVALERKFGVTLDEEAYAAARTIGDLRKLLDTSSGSSAGGVVKSEIVSVDAAEQFPRWNRSALAKGIRRVNLPLWVLPLARVFAHVRAEGLENLAGVQGPVIFAPNHQSHMDIPALMIALPGEWRYRIAPAMSKDFFRPHFHPGEFGVRERFTNDLNYYLSSLVFNAFPLPQRGAGARGSLRYFGELTGEGWCPVIFPEGHLTQSGEIASFQAGIGMLASRLDVPVIPVRLTGLDKVLHRSAKMATPGRVTVTFGKPLRLHGEDYAALAKQVESAVRQL